MSLVLVSHSVFGFAWMTCQHSGEYKEDLGNTNAERTEIVGNIFPVAFGCKVSFVLDSNMRISLLFSVVPIPA